MGVSIGLKNKWVSFQELLEATKNFGDTREHLFCVTISNSETFSCYNKNVPNDHSNA